MFYFFQPLNHIRRVREWVRRNDASVSLDIETFRLRVTRGQQTVQFFPRFSVDTGAGFAYSGYFGERGPFIGWLPYELKRWPVASDKLVFKQYCKQTGLPIPAYWQQGAPQSEHFIVKGQRGSFGQGFRGPFSADQAHALGVVLNDGEYFEQFITGECVKVWCWNGRPTAMERLSAPFVVGDGRRTLREIVGKARGSFDSLYDLDSSRDILAWQGFEADSVVAEGQQVRLDFRYATPFDRTVITNRDVLSQQSDIMRAQLQQIGNSLAQAIPDEFRLHTVFTVDAVVDAHDQLWLLEMNSHPMVHPANYMPMLDDLFGVA